MAFEKQLIASMNNPNAAEAWREASFQCHWKMYHADRAIALEDEIEKLVGNVMHHRETAQRAQSELKASREENRAVHEELGEAYETGQSALTLASTYSEAYFEQQVRACRAEKIALRWAMLFFAIVTLQTIGAWGALLMRLP